MNRWIFDTHSHYDDEAFDQDRHELLGSLRDKGVGQLVNVGADMASSKETLALAKQYDFIHAALGVHPSEVADLTEADMDWIRSHASEEKGAEKVVSAADPTGQGSAASGDHSQPGCSGRDHGTIERDQGL